MYPCIRVVSSVPFSFFASISDTLFCQPVSASSSISSSSNGFKLSSRACWLDIISLSVSLSSILEWVNCTVNSRDNRGVNGGDNCAVCGAVNEYTAGSRMPLPARNSISPRSTRCWRALQMFCLVVDSLTQMIAVWQANGMFHRRRFASYRR